MTHMSKSRSQSCVFKQSKLVRTGVLSHNFKENRFATDHEIIMTNDMTNNNYD